MKYFTLKECIYSATAEAKGIDNTPSAEHKAHIMESIETLVDHLREAWEVHCHQAGLGIVGITISSGYRSPALNAAVHGSATSAHCYGYAFDPLQPSIRSVDLRKRRQERNPKLDARRIQTSGRKTAWRVSLYDKWRVLLYD